MSMYLLDNILVVILFAKIVRKISSMFNSDKVQNWLSVFEISFILMPAIN